MSSVDCVKAIINNIEVAMINNFVINIEAPRRIRPMMLQNQRID